jgi:hypothetical protein
MITSSSGNGGMLGTSKKRGAYGDVISGREELPKSSSERSWNPPESMPYFHNLLRVLTYISLPPKPPGRSDAK